MKKMKFSIFVVAIVLAICAIGPVYAEDNTYNNYSDQYNYRDDRSDWSDRSDWTDQTKKTETVDSKDTTKKGVRGKLNESRRGACLLRTNRVKGIMMIAANQAQKHLQTFTKIYERVVSFYDSKDLNVANYDELVAKITTKKLTAEQAVENLRSDISFDCYSDDPIGQIVTFKSKLRAAHVALKEYRTSIKNLIVAIKTSINKEARS